MAANLHTHNSTIQQKKKGERERKPFIERGNDEMKTAGEKKNTDRVDKREGERRKSRARSNSRMRRPHQKSEGVEKKKQPKRKNIRTNCCTFAISYARVIIAVKRYNCDVIRHHLAILIATARELFASS